MEKELYNRNNNSKNQQQSLKRFYRIFFSRELLFKGLDFVIKYLEDTHIPVLT